ncbi:MAG: hypothetical protein ACI89X_001869 [Planctomycetota bacterium]|jgi:hypothetical protein
MASVHSAFPKVKPCPQPRDRRPRTVKNSKMRSAASCLRRCHGCNARSPNTHPLRNHSVLTTKINRLQGQLEQLPTCELTLQRGRAHLSSLQESKQELSDRRAQAKQRAAENTKHGIKAAYLQVDSQVTLELLLDIEAQLARIRPVSYEVLQTREPTCTAASALRAAYFGVTINIGGTVAPAGTNFIEIELTQ